jgi:hypothetical protein
VLLGVDDGLLPVTEAEAERLMMLIKLTQDPPDEDSRRLARAVLTTPDAQRWPGGTKLAEGFCRALIGDDLADGLQIPRTPFRHAVRAISLVATPVDRVRATSRLVESLFVKLGERYWAEAIERSAPGAPLTYTPASGLAG